MPFWKCYYHVVWATENRQTVITAEIEPRIHDIVRRKSTALKCDVIAINGTEDHIHVAVMIRPSLAVSEWVQQVKGITAHELNHTYPDMLDTFKWQNGYGVLTFGAKNLAYVVRYIERQKDHHRENQLEPYLETIE